MSLSHSIPFLRGIPAERHSQLVDDQLWIASYFSEPPVCEEAEFTIHTALDLPFLRRFLDAYPQRSTDELQKIAVGVMEPNVGKLVEILELIDQTIDQAAPGHHWSRYPRATPPLDEQNRNSSLWLYAEDEAAVVVPGSYAEIVNEHGLTPYPFRNEAGDQVIITHWALRKHGEEAPIPPPIFK